MKAIWPAHVFVIRGNHEFAGLCSAHGFLTQVLAMHGFSVFQAATECFGYIPLAAKIGRVLCVHGGLGPDVTTVGAIRALARPVEDFSDPVVDALMWSDPSERLLGFEPSEARGAGYAFGESALVNFLRLSNLDAMIRAHECVADGHRWQFGRRLLTVFSASNYTGIVGNYGAVAEINAAGEIEVHQFAPLPYIMRTAAQIKPAVMIQAQFQKTLACQAYPVAAGAEAVAQRVDKTNAALQFPALIIARRAEPSDRRVGR
jgi:diadenosine tetraphosphatase ApaH/serine/threonine PP2A family protein phosphatase